MPPRPGANEKSVSFQLKVSVSTLRSFIRRGLEYMALPLELGEIASAHLELSGDGTRPMPQDWTRIVAREAFGLTDDNLTVGVVTQALRPGEWLTARIARA